MRVRVLGAGFYGAHIGAALIREGYDVEVHEIAPDLFAGASGAIPARLHIGCHYPRSALTRAACREHHAEFMFRYGFLTHGVRTNIYAIADTQSLVDFDQYRRTLAGEIEFITLHDPGEFGLRNVEGAIMVGERHILIEKAKRHFREALGERLRVNTPPGDPDDSAWDWTIDATFCAQDAAGVDRYEPCLVVFMTGDRSTAVTIMDGPFPSLYPWDEDRGLSSLSSARWTPFSKDCRTYEEARAVLDGLERTDIERATESMRESMARFYPAIWGMPVMHKRTSIRAMPASGADARLVDVRRRGERIIGIRAGKIDAIFAAEREVKRIMEAKL